MAPKKIHRIKYASLTGRERRSSLQECLESKSDVKRRCHKNWITVLLLLIALHYTYSYYWLPDATETTSNTALADRGDELLTTKAPPTYEVVTQASQIGSPLQDNNLVYKIKTTYRIVSTRSRKLPKCIRKKRSGPYALNTTSLNITTLENEYPSVKEGGFYQPLNCTPKHKVAIIVPYRGREANLGIFLYNIHPFLMGQQIVYQIFIIEQAGTDIFNKGRLFNAGFKEVQKLEQFHCVVFHDLDLLPTNLEILYTCPTLPRHMCAAVNTSEVKKMGLSYELKSLFGGVVSMSMEMVQRANGYSNLYFGWGGEDNDMFWRLRAAGYPVVRYNKSVGIFTILPHTRAPVNKFRYHLLVRAVERYKMDGLSNLEYVVVSKESHHLYTHIVVNINPRNENITDLTARWTTGDNSF